MKKLRQAFQTNIVRNLSANRLIVETLESRLLLSVDLFFETATVYGLSGEVQPGDACSLEIDGIGNLGDDTVYLDADIRWSLALENDPYSDFYNIWTGMGPLIVSPYFSDLSDWNTKSITENATVPDVPPGDYYIVVYLNFDYDPTETDYENNYVVFKEPVTVLPYDDYGDTIDTATPINLGQTISGEINYYNETMQDVDVFKFYVQEEDYTSIVFEPETGKQLNAKLCDIDGIEVLYDFSDSNVLSTYFPEDGVYYIVISSQGNGASLENIGTYSLDVYLDDYGNSTETATELEMDTVLPGNLEVDMDWDYFSFHALAGHEYRLRGTQVWEDEYNAPILYLFDQDGLTLLESDSTSGLGLSAYIVWTAPEDGEYFIGVMPFETGNYWISIADGPAEWTFMMYIAGDNNLEAYMSPDVNEMILGLLASEDILSPNVNIILQTDGWEKDWSYYDYWQNSTWRYVLSPTFFGTEIGEENMGDPDTLVDYVNWATTEFPAEHYALVLWDHGGGFRGACSEHDQYGNSWDILTMKDFSDASNAFNEHLDIIGFSACLMAGIEPAYQIKDAAEIYIASEPSEWLTQKDGINWNYKVILQELLNDPQMDKETLSQIIIDSYTESPGLSTNDAISATDLNAIENLANRINVFADYMLNDASISDWLIFQEARDNAIEMATEGSYPYSDFCDMGYLMQFLIDISNNSRLNVFAQEVVYALSDAVFYEWHDDNLAGVTGLTIYIPEQNDIIHPDYNQDIAFLRDTNWDEFVEVFVSGDYPDFVPISTKGLTFTDSDGTNVRVKLAKGEGTVTFNGLVTDIITGRRGTEIVGQGLMLSNIDITNSSDKTSLMITAKGGTVEGTTVGNISGASLGKLTGKQLDLVGDITLTGSLGSLILDDISEYVTITTGAEAAKGFSVKVDDIGDDVHFDIAGTVKKFQATQFANGSIEADNIGKVTVKEGSFNVDIEARNGDILGVTAYNIIGDITASGTIKKLTSKYEMLSGDIQAEEIGKITSAKDITGDISTNGLIGKIISKSGDFTGAARAGANIGTIKAINLNDAIISAGTDIKKVSMKGNIFDSYILAGYDIGIDCAFGLLETGGGDLPGSGNIKSVTAKGDFARSYLCAGTLPYTSETMAALTDGLPFNGNFGSIGKVKFGGIDYLNATEEFGLFAVTDIKPFKIGKDKAEPRDYFNIDILLAG